MWVRFWCGEQKNPGIDLDYDQFEWMRETLSDEWLLESAREHRPDWAKDWDSHNTIYYGFERLAELPEAVRLKLVKHHKGQIAHSNAMLKILGDSR